MFSFFRRKKQLGTGVIEDPRPIEEKQQDFEVEEVLKAEVINWQPKDQSQWRKFPIFNQDGSSSCVLQTIAKILGVDNVLEEGKFIWYSARDGYSKRSNKPGEGMYLQDGLQIAYKTGLTLEQLMPSHGLNESQMNNDSDRKTIDQQIALVGKAGNYVQTYGTIDFNAIASVINKGKAVALIARFNSGDWSNGEVICRSNGQYGHAVAIVDYCLYKGERALIFDNSWDYSWGFKGQGVIRESQKAGIMGWGYLLDLKNTWRDEVKPREKPQFVFNKDLIFGQRNWDIGMLQECLQYLEMFPVNVPSTMYYGNITKNAVILFINKYFPDKATLFDGKKVNGTLRTKLNELFK